MSNLSRQKARQKKSAVQNQQKEFSSVKGALRNKLNLIDFSHINTLFLELMTRL